MDTLTTLGTQSQFGYEWAIYRDILPMHREQFLRWIAPFQLSDFKGKRFIDAGCGIGRNSFWPLEAGASSCYAFDYDERTVEVAKENLKSFPNAQVELKSIYDLTFNKEFDIAFSIGVIHHLVDPKKAVTRLVDALKPGGHLILWVYGHEGNELYLKVVDPLRRNLLALIPKALTRWVSKILTPVLWLYVRLPTQKPYLKLLRQMNLKHLEAIIFDQLLPTIAFYWRKEEVLDLVKDLPVKNIQLNHTNGMSWTLVAERA